MAFQVLFLGVIGGAGLAQIVQIGLQAFLSCALLGEFATDAGDGGGLAFVALLGGLELVLGSRGPGLLGLDLLVSAPQQQG